MFSIDFVFVVEMVRDRRRGGRMRGYRFWSFYYCFGGCYLEEFGDKGNLGRLGIRELILCFFFYFLFLRVLLV